MDRNEELLARFEREYMEINSITPDRRKQQLKLLRTLAATLDHPLDRLTGQDIRTFIGANIADGFHPNTARKHVGMIRAFVTWAFEAGVIDHATSDELKSVRNPRGSSRQSKPNPYKIAEVMRFKALLAEKYPTLPEYGKGSLAMRRFMRGDVPRLRRHLWRHARRLQFEAQIALALEAGLRRVEIAHLTIPAMHYDNDEVVVLTAKQGPGSNVTRTVPYTTHARNCMQEWLDFRLLLRPPHESPWLQLDYCAPLNGEHWRGAQLAPQTYRSFRSSLTEAFGVGWEWRRFRHTAATEWLRSGVPLEKVSMFMGHATLEQTRAYTQILDTDISDAFGKAEADFARRLGLAA